MSSSATSDFIPTDMRELRARGWSALDVLLVTGDAYFDHPTHGAAVIARTLEARGYRVGIVAQPDWRTKDALAVMGRPELFVGVTAGAVDSTLNNYTADLNKRRSDSYSPGGRGGVRPNFATAVYANLARQAFPGIPVIIGGIEASTRRFSYWDYLKGRPRRSALLDSKADLLVYGPGEKQVLEVAHRLADGRDLEGIPGTTRLAGRDFSPPDGAVTLPAHRDIEASPELLLQVAVELERTGIPGFRRHMLQETEEGVLVASPPMSYDTADLDETFALPFSRAQHPSYLEPIPALETVRWSVISHRGCPGGCSFCALALHQGRGVVSRSPESILDEIAALASRPDFKGTITDVGGPTANAFALRRKDQARCEACARPSCLHPRICANLEVDHGALLSLLRAALRIPNVKRILLASGIRHDLALQDPSFIDAVAAHHTGGHLKVAPEHVDPATLKAMRKPPIERFEEFERRFSSASRAAGLQQYLVPYFIAGFPGCSPKAADRVKAWLAKRGQRLRQVQTFIPLPGTVAAARFAAGRDHDGTELYVADGAERRRQKEIMTSPASRSGSGSGTGSGSGVKRNHRRRVKKKA